MTVRPLDPAVIGEQCEHTEWVPEIESWVRCTANTLMHTPDTRVLCPEHCSCNEGASVDYPPLPDFLHAESEPVRYSKDEDGPQGEPNMNTLLRRSYELPDVAGDRWTDQYKPTVIGTAPCRVAAEAMLSGIEWDSVFHDEGPGDPLERLGTLSVLQGYAYISRRDENTLIAWFASRLHRVDMCMTDGHEDEDFGRYFNDCWGDDGESDHEWESWWAVDADPEEFWAFVQQVVRR